MAKTSYYNLSLYFGKNRFGDLDLAGKLNNADLCHYMICFMSILVVSKLIHGTWGLFLPIQKKFLLSFSTEFSPRLHNLS